MLSILKVQDLCALAGERGTGVRDIAIGAGGLGFNFRVGQILHSVASGSPPLRRYVRAGLPRR